MRRSDQDSGSLFSYVDLGPGSAPTIRWARPGDRQRCAEAVSAELGALYASGVGRPSIPPERLLRASRLQASYGIQSERQIMERLEFDLLFRWFVGLGIDDAVWDPTTFGKNRDRLLAGDVAAAEVLADSRVKRLLGS